MIPGTGNGPKNDREMKKKDWTSAVLLGAWTLAYNRPSAPLTRVSSGALVITANAIFYRDAPELASLAEMRASRLPMATDGRTVCEPAALPSLKRNKVASASLCIQ